MAGPAVARHVERHEDRFFTGCLAAFGIQLGVTAALVLVACSVLAGAAAASWVILGAMALHPLP